MCAGWSPDLKLGMCTQRWPQAAPGAIWRLQAPSKACVFAAGLLACVWYAAAPVVWLWSKLVWQTTGADQAVAKVILNSK